MLLSQDDLNALFGGESESQSITLRAEPVAEDNHQVKKSEIMSQHEIDDLLRQFDRDA